MSLSRSQPFFNSRHGRSRVVSTDYMTDEQYKRLHWTEQLRLRPLRDRKAFVKGDGDYDNRLDNFDTDESREEIT